MLQNRPLTNVHATLIFWGSQASTLMAFVLPKGPAQAPSSSGSVILTSSAAFPPFSTTRPLGLIMNDLMIDNPPPSSSFQSSDSSASETSSAHANNTTTSAVTGARHIPSTGPIIAGILAGMIVVATIIIIIFVKRRHKRSRRRHHPFEAQINLQSCSHVHRLSRMRDEEVPSENDSPKQKYRRHSHHSRYSSTTVVADVVPQSAATGGKKRSKSSTHKSSLPSGDRRLHSIASSTSSTLSPAINTDKIGDSRSNHLAVDGIQTSMPSPTPLSSETVPSNQFERYTSGPTSRTELPLQPPSSSSQNEIPFQHSIAGNNSVSPPESRLQHLNALIQQRATLLASINTSDKSLYNELLLLDEQIQILRRQEVSPSQQDEPPPYEGHR